MGCGAGVMKPAEPEQQEEMCAWTSKDVVIVCLQHVLNENVKNKNLQIQAPTTELDNFRKMPGELRTAAEKLKSTADSGGQAASDKAKGLLGEGGLLGKAAEMAGAVATGVTGAVGGATGTVLCGFADKIEGLLTKVDQQFATVAGEVAGAKVAEIIEVYNNILKEAQFSECLKLCRGKEPYGQDEFDQCPSDNITKAFMAVAGDRIAPALHEAVQEEIKSNALVKTWDDSIEQINAASQKMNELVGAEKKDVVKLNLNNYIVDEIVKKLAEEMGKREGDFRKEPDGKSSNPQGQATFSLCLSGKTITRGDYQNFKKPKN